MSAIDRLEYNGLVRAISQRSEVNTPRRLWCGPGRQFRREAGDSRCAFDLLLVDRPENLSAHELFQSNGRRAVLHFATIDDRAFFRDFFSILRGGVLYCGDLDGGARPEPNS